MYPDLHDKVAIVTGASRGIGRAIAQRLSAEGMRLLLVARSADALAELADACPAPAAPLALDLREADAPVRAVEAAIARFGRLDALVNNAGTTRRGDFLALADEDWYDGFALKFHAARRASRAAWPHLAARAGTIVNIVGIGARTASAEFTIGGAVNSALLNLTKALADRGVGDGVRVNAINPGAIATDRLETRVAAHGARTGLAPAAARTALAAELGIARFGEPAEIAAMVAFLLSAQAAFCQGALIDVDGGQTRAL